MSRSIAVPSWRRRGWNCIPGFMVLSSTTPGGEGMPSVGVVRRRGQSEELLESAPAARVVGARELGTDVAQMPGFGRIAGDRRALVFVPDDPPELPRVRRDPLLLGGAGERLESDAPRRARRHVGGEPRLMLAEPRPRADEVGVTGSPRRNETPVGRALSVVRAEAA